MPRRGGDQPLGALSRWSLPPPHLRLSAFGIRRLSTTELGAAHLPCTSSYRARWAAYRPLNRRARSRSWLTALPLRRCQCVRPTAWARRFHPAEEARERAISASADHRGSVGLARSPSSDRATLREGHIAATSDQMSKPPTTRSVASPKSTFVGAGTSAVVLHPGVDPSACEAGTQPDEIGRPPDKLSRPESRTAGSARTTAAGWSMDLKPARASQAQRCRRPSQERTAATAVPSRGFPDDFRSHSRRAATGSPSARVMPSGWEQPRRGKEDMPMEIPAAAPRLNLGPWCLRQTPRRRQAPARLRGARSFSRFE